MHLTIDAISTDPKKLSSPSLLRKFLDALPTQIGMTKISKPLVTKYEGPVKEDWGYSGFVLIAESHIAVHTFPDRKQIWIDIFSCKSFDESLSIESVKKEFALTKIIIKKLQRGLEYQQNLRSSTFLNSRGRDRLLAKRP